MLGYELDVAVDGSDRLLQSMGMYDYVHQLIMANSLPECSSVPQSQSAACSKYSVPAPTESHQAALAQVLLGST